MIAMRNAIIVGSEYEDDKHCFQLELWYEKAFGSRYWACTLKHAYNKVFGRAILLRYQHNLLNPSSLQYKNKVTGNENHITISVNSL